MPKGKCRNCGAHSPVIKKQGAMRLFKVWPSAKAAMANAKSGISLRGVLGGGAEEAQEAVAAIEAQAAEVRAGWRGGGCGFVWRCGPCAGGVVGSCSPVFQIFCTCHTCSSSCFCHRLWSYGIAASCTALDLHRTAPQPTHGRTRLHHAPAGSGR